MSTLKVDTIKSDTTPTVTISDGLSVTGVTTSTGDISIADTIVHTGDTNTKIRFPAADTISAETGGSERLRITSAGLVGIGTDSPQKTLNVFAVSGTTELIRLSQNVNASVQQEFGIGWCSNNAHTHPGAQITSLEYDASDPRRDLLFYTRGVNSDSAPTERLRIDSSGNMGLGGAPIAPGHLTFHMNNGTSSAATRFHMTTNTTGATASDGFTLSIDGSSSDVNLVQRETANMLFYTAGSERARITGVGTVFIVRSSPTMDPYTNSIFEVRGNTSGGNAAMRITNDVTGAKSKSGIIFNTSTGDYTGACIFHQRDHGRQDSQDALVFGVYSGSGNYYGATSSSTGLDDTYEAMRIWGTSGSNNRGGVGIGTSTPAQGFSNTSSANSNGSLVVAAPLGSNAMTLVPWTSHTAGVGNNIIGLNFAGGNYYTSSNRCGVFYQLLAQNDHGSYGDRGRMRFNPGYDGNSNSDGKSLVMSFNGDFWPVTDDSCDLGLSGNRWDDVYASNGTIQTSDETLKQNIVGLTTAEMNAAKRISALFKTYKWKAAVSSKGSNARTHVGVTAQSVKAALEAESLDPNKYAFYTADTVWKDSDGETVGTHKAGPGVYDKLTDTTEPIPDASSGITSSTTYGVRYGELTSFVNAYNEQRFTSIESRLAALESA